MTGQPATVEVKDEDLRRGVVDIQGIAANVRTNAPAGYVIAFRFDAEVFDKAEITGLGQSISVGRGGAFIVRRQNLKDQSLQVQLHLHEGAAMGRYPWPLRIEVRLLNTR